ncbi:hypothetical protein LXT21_42810 [Myxococcus sp. K38C18041901]|uniref:hypothetical protein n=1 Tax=Myxococcus guangdongensis TaxID=2906760 RepID=UPI0020A76F45|nr:hypothetical protein [Myxococcus guangdongensis]MCP3065517.1 hypothetical protein [Myxococcus guangdongensis]
MSLSSPSLPSLVPVTQPRRFREWRALFVGLPTPARETLPGRYRGELLGPAWFQGLVRQGLGLLGLRGWWGKDFAPGGHGGVNLVRREGGLTRSVPLVLREGRSRVDGRESLQVEYARGAGWQWRPFVDELRWLEGRTLLAMTHLELPLVRHLTIPFLLHREPTLH